MIRFLQLEQDQQLEILRQLPLPSYERLTPKHARLGAPVWLDNQRLGLQLWHPYRSPGLAWWSETAPGQWQQEDIGDRPSRAYDARRHGDGPIVTTTEHFFHPQHKRSVALAWSEQGTPQKLGRRISESRPHCLLGSG